MLVFHPEVHSSSRKDAIAKLKEYATSGKVVLLQECREYVVQELPYTGFESLKEGFKESILCSLYQMNQVPYETLKDGKEHSKSVFLFFMCCLRLFPEMTDETLMYISNDWFPDFNHFMTPLNFNVEDYSSLMDNMRQYIRTRARVKGGLPSNIPYSFIQKCTINTIQQVFPHDLIDNIVIQKTLIEREKHMANNIHDALRQCPDTPIHVCIGAGHLMPYLDKNVINILQLDSNFLFYHNSIKEKRLLDYFSEYKIQVL